MSSDPDTANESSTDPGTGTASPRPAAKPEKPKVKPGRHWYVVIAVGLLLTVGGGATFSILGFSAPPQHAPVSTTGDRNNRL